MCVRGGEGAGMGLSRQTDQRFVNGVEGGQMNTDIHVFQVKVRGFPF